MGIAQTDRGYLWFLFWCFMEEGSHKAHRGAKAGRKAEKKAKRKNNGDGSKTRNPKVLHPYMFHASHSP